jgi:hypothetical protein
VALALDNEVVSGNRRPVILGALMTAVLALGTLPVAVGAPTALGASPASHCSAGARTLSRPGSRLYPDTGNGGYTSLHTDVDMVYDATTNRFLPGNHVVLTDRATKCLSSFSLDLERHSANHTSGPSLKVISVRVDGKAAAFHFARPTYPGDPLGVHDRRKRAHEASQTDPVRGPHHNPLPPACSPERLTPKTAPRSLDGTLCPANKLIITPRAPIPAGARFTVTVAYTGRPGVHNDGDGTTEGWFRAPDGGFVTTEPVGSEDWMPLNDFPSAKPTYDFHDTVNAGKTAVANGILVSSVHHGATANFPGGSTTWNWHATAPIASYLVESSVGNFTLTERTADNGIHFYRVQDQAIPQMQQAANTAVIKQQQDITEFESQFNGAYPFTSDGVVVGTPDASFEEEMETMITFAGGEADVDTLYHENMHQWWGDNVSESSYSMTFFKEGLATLAEELFGARTAETGAGGPTSAAGQKAFETSLRADFKQIYNAGGSFWIGAPSNPTSNTLFSGSATYSRPSGAYIALRQILGHTRFVEALQQIQRRYGGASITEPQLEAEFGSWLPVSSTASCETRLATFFRQWFDTSYAKGGTARPKITGPGLVGQDFYGHGGCRL